METVLSLWLFLTFFNQSLLVFRVLAVSITYWMNSEKVGKGEDFLLFFFLYLEIISSCISRNLCSGGLGSFFCILSLYADMSLRAKQRLNQEQNNAEENPVLCALSLC